MAFEGGDELVAADRAPAQADVDVPGLMIDAAADVLDLVRVVGAERLGDLPPAMLHAVAEPDRLDLSVVDGRPGVHRHRVGVVQEPDSGLADLADVLAEIEHDGNRPLPIEHAPGADRVADALVDAVLERNANVVCEGRKSSDPCAVDDVAGALERSPSIGRRLDQRRQMVRLDDRFQDLPDHAEVAFVDVGERDIDRLQLGNAEHVRDQLAGEPDAAGADNRDLQSRHCNALA